MASNTVIDLGYRPRAWQAEFHLNLKRWNVAVLHRRAGKTILAIMTLIDKALRFQGQAGRFGYLAPFYNQAKSIAWGPLKAYASKIPGVVINESELWIEFPHNKARIRLFGGDNAEALRGGYFDFIVLDELKDIKPEVWSDIIRPALSDRQGGCLMMGTPSGINLLSETYWKAVGSDEWNVCLRTVYDTEALPSSEIEAAKRDMTDQAFAREFLCDFNAATEEQLISYTVAEEASKRTLRTDQYEFAAKILGVDVAFAEDGDRSVIFPRQGLAAFKPKWWRGIDNMELADQVMASWDKWQADAVFIDRGRGEGVGSRLVQLGYNPIMVDFGGRAQNPIHINKKTEMWFEMLAWLNGGGAIPNLPELKRDLCAPQYDSNNAQNKLQLERKELMKKRGLPSPDLADALALTFAFPVQPNLAHVHPSLDRRGIVADFDPFAAA